MHFTCISGRGEHPKEICWGDHAHKTPNNKIVKPPSSHNISKQSTTSHDISHLLRPALPQWCEAEAMPECPRRPAGTDPRWMPPLFSHCKSTQGVGIGTLTPVTLIHITYLANHEHRCCICDATEKRRCICDATENRMLNCLYAHWMHWDIPSIIEYTCTHRQAFSDRYPES